MTHTKFSFFLIVLMLITVGTFVAGLEAQDTEQNSANVQEFVKKAQEHVKQNEIEEAIELYERIMIAVPEDDESRVQLATLYSRTKQHEKAAQTYSKLLKTDPENIKYQDELVNSKQAAGKHNEAVEIAQAYVQIYPEVGVHYARLAKLYDDEGNKAEAIKNYKKATTFGYDDKEIYLKLAEHYFLNEDITAAENAFKNALKLTTSEWDRQKIDRQLIKLYRSQGNLEEILLKAKTDGTISFEMQKELARLLLNAGELEKSIEAFKKAREMTNDVLDQDNVSVELIKACLKQDRADLALEFYEAEVAKKSRSKLGSTTTFSPTSGITVRFGSDETRKILINVYKDQGKLEDLRTYFEGKLKKEVDNPEFLQLLAEIYWDGEEYQKSADAYHKLTKVEPNNVRCIYHAAAAFYKSNQQDIIKELLQQAEAALATNPYKQNSKYLGALASICLNGEIYATAIKLADNALQNTSDAFYETYLYEILAKSYIGANRYQEAYEAYQQMANVADSRNRKRAETGMKETAKAGKLKVKKNINESMQIWQAAQIYETQEKLKDAIVQYEKLTELEPENSQWHQKLGELYQKSLSLEKRETGEVIEGTALTLYGNRSYVEINDSHTLNNITDQVTVSAWIKPTDFPNSYEAIICRSDERGPNFRIVKNRSYVLYLKNNGSIQMAASPNGRHETSFYSESGSIKLNTWYHIACVIDPMSDSMKLFIDGIEVGNTFFKGEKRLYRSRLPLRIGWTHEEERPTQSSFVGQIDEVRIWNIARTENEISSDMNKQLNGDEPGLVAYWKFDEETEGRIFDSSPNKNDGILIRNAKLEPYTRPIYESLKLEGLAKSISAYEKAVELKPTSYQLYDLLAKTYIKAAWDSQAEATYRRALDAPLTQSEHGAVIHSIVQLYDGEHEEKKHIDILEEIRQSGKMENSAVLHELLGDLYKKVGDADKAELAYDKWLQIRQKALISAQNAYSYRIFAEKLLDKGLYPETALNFAKRAFSKNTGSSYDYPTTVGRACIANGLYDDALKHFKYALNLIPNEYDANMFWDKVAELIMKANNKARYIQLLAALTNAIPADNSSPHKNAYRTLAQFLCDNDMPEKAEDYLFKVGFVPETAWLTLGPFDNKDNIGYYIPYIPEETTQIDATAQYYGIDKLIRWKKLDDNEVNGMIWLGEDIDWTATYTWAIVYSPDERDITIRFDSDDQGIIWLNGKEVFRHDRMNGAQVDRYTVPVTLQQGDNTILVKVCNEAIHTCLFMRLTDRDGNPFKDLKFKNTDELLNAPPPKPTFHVNVNLGLAEYYSKNNMPDKAMEQIRQTGVIHEKAWLILGPFDNTTGIGYDTEYIPEDSEQIDLTEKYEGVDEQISWEKFTDDVFNGFIEFGGDVNWFVSYAMATVTSPDEREVLFRFSSDAPSKICLNGTEVFTDANAQTAILDKNTIPITLKAGKNTILVKVCKEEMSCGFYLRVTDADGKPFEDLKIKDVQDN